MKRLSPTQQQAWDAFAEHANWQSLHGHDLNRFAWFVVRCHRHRRQAYVDLPALVAEHVTDPDTLAEVVSQLEDLYLFGRQLLRVSRYTDFLA